MLSIVIMFFLLSLLSLLALFMHFALEATPIFCTRRVIYILSNKCFNTKQNQNSGHCTTYFHQNPLSWTSQKRNLQR